MLGPMRLSFRRSLPLLALAGGAWYLRQVHRFRDPVRLPSGDAPLLAPADGRVVWVKRSGSPEARALGWPDLPTDGWLVGVATGALDVHYSYAPISGEVSALSLTPARDGAPSLALATQLPLRLGGLTALDPAQLAGAERLSYRVEVPGDTAPVTGHLLPLGRQLGATVYAAQGGGLRQGNKVAFLPEGGLSFVAFGSHLTPAVSVGERVLGAQTVLAR